MAERSNADKLALKAELTTDPKTLGLTLLPADDEANSVKLSTVNATILIDREAIPLNEIMVNVDLDEFSALSVPQRQWLLGIGGPSGSINPKQGGEVYEGILQLFAQGSETRNNLLLILKAPSNRIEQMFKQGLLQAGGNVSPSDISSARAAT